MTSKYKILYLTYHPEIGGGETILVSTIASLDRKLFEPVAVVTKKGQLYQKLQSLKIKTYVCPLNGYFVRTFFVPGISPWGIFNFYKIAKAIKPDIIHLNHLNLAIYCAVSAKLLKIPLVATSHGRWDSVYFFQDVITNLFVDKILANTPALTFHLRKRHIIAKTKLQTVLFGINTNYFKPQSQAKARKRLKLKDTDIIFTIVGRLDPVKDHLTFLKAAQIVAKKYKNVTFFIVGSKQGDFTGKKNAYLKEISNFLKKDPGLAKKVVFGGFIGNMPQVYNATDVLVSSSISESFGLALAEAASCSVPIVTTNVGGQNLIVQNNLNGYLIAAQKPRLMAKKMLQLYRNKRLRERFGKNGRLKIIDEFNLKTYVRIVQNNYLKLIQKTHG